jgi:hypothetical protein
VSYHEKVCNSYKVAMSAPIAKPFRPLLHVLFLSSFTAWKYSPLPFHMSAILNSFGTVIQACAMLNLGLMLESGRGGLPQDLKAAFQLYQKAAEKGVAEAYCKVALIPNP